MMILSIKIKTYLVLKPKQIFCDKMLSNRERIRNQIRLRMIDKESFDYY